MAGNHQDDFMSLYLNFVSLMNVSNASRVSSKSARWMLLMEFLASFQTCSMGFLSGLYGGRKVIQGVVLKDYNASAAVMVCSNVSRGRR